jgi:hypothetical protein
MTIRAISAAVLLLAGTAALPALAANYQFMSSPATGLNLMYRLDRLTGEVGACQYGLKDGTVGTTLCYRSGDGAGPQTSSDYALAASHHEGEAGIFRVDLRNGTMSICYLLNDAIVCTPPGK